MKVHFLCATLFLAACGQGAGTASTGALTPVAPVYLAAPPAIDAHGSPKVQHIVIIVQENRTVDNLFNGFPGADTVKAGKNTYGQTVELQPIPLWAKYDLSHKHSAWVADYDNGKMDGFNQESMNCRKKAKCPPRDVASYGLVPPGEVKPYWTMAREYTFADRMFATNQGPSFPAHQYIISGTSTISNGSPYRASDNAQATGFDRPQGGCNSVRIATVPTIGTNGVAGPEVYPCFDRTSIMGRMDGADVTWHYYQERGGADAWNAVDAVEPIWDSPSYKRVKWPSKSVLDDIADGDLAQVTFITPSPADSDHAQHTNGDGPAWVASVVNAIGESPFWDTTTIFVVWDDWGGWYDHVRPKIYNSYELGFRVPLIVIGPYVKAGYVSHQQHEFGSILKFIEKRFGLPSLHTTDVRSDDFSDCFDFTQPPRRFKKIPSTKHRDYFLHEPLSDDPVDDDF